MQKRHLDDIKTALLFLENAINLGGVSGMDRPPAEISRSSIVRSRTLWSVEELTRLDDLAKQNFSLRVIALKLGRSVAAVDAKAAQVKIALRRMKRPYRRKGESAPK